MEKLNERLTILFSLAWLIYLLSTIIQSLVDFQNVKRIDWQKTENVSSTYTGYKATIITRSYKKDNIIIKRDYGFFGQGINMAFSGVDQNNKYVNLTFYVKNKDYSLNEQERTEIPYFALREIDQPASFFSVILDLWKFNYSKTIAFIILFCPLLLIFLVSKIKVKNFKIEELNVNSKMVNYLYLLFMICLLFNFIV